tara:strand:+ start:319 stop:504 length:186 start_codon:yes stop_codon:yes gene_type:complete
MNTALMEMNGIQTNLKQRNSAVHVEEELMLLIMKTKSTFSGNFIRDGVRIQYKETHQEALF